MSSIPLCCFASIRSGIAFDRLSGCLFITCISNRPASRLQAQLLHVWLFLSFSLDPHCNECYRTSGQQISPSLFTQSGEIWVSWNRATILAVGWSSSYTPNNTIVCPKTNEFNDESMPKSSRMNMKWFQCQWDATRARVCVCVNWAIVDFRGHSTKPNFTHLEIANKIQLHCTHARRFPPKILHLE